mmetsp:Transcript_5282/g.15884  ORF Transcript_5282/g.15884 Transcript_5282/m.15884 type:complete len:98 (-) Transcript_5282:1379-1672(-)
MSASVGEEGRGDTVVVEERVLATVKAKDLRWLVGERKKKKKRGGGGGVEEEEEEEEMEGSDLEEDEEEEIEDEELEDDLEEIEMEMDHGEGRREDVS